VKFCTSAEIISASNGSHVALSQHLVRLYRHLSVTSHINKEIQSCKIAEWCVKLEKLIPNFFRNFFVVLCFFLGIMLPLILAAYHSTTVNSPRPKVTTEHQ